mmetsp:Transcript_18158/g.26939  ORF Transcript_18158/g.26939 Transcript_18158/m.26939 type:complete len:118 (+) Transcript_18158:72-425(+)
MMMVQLRFSVGFCFSYIYFHQSMVVSVWLGKDRSDKLVLYWVDALVDEFISIMDVSKGDLESKRLSQLSPSEQYIVGIICCCLKSVISSVIPSTTALNHNDAKKIGLQVGNGKFDFM